MKVVLDKEIMDKLDEAFGIRRGPNQCPTCKAIGDEPCVRGRWPSPVWQQKIPFPEGHDSRRTLHG